MNVFDLGESPGSERSTALLSLLYSLLPLTAAVGVTGRLLNFFGRVFEIVLTR